MPLARKVTGLRFGIFGLGRIGAAIAKRLEPFGKILYSDLAPKDVQYTYCPDVKTLAAGCDVLVLARSADGTTRHIVSESTLEALGSDGYLVNVARGSLVCERALVTALQSKCHCRSRTRRFRKRTGYSRRSTVGSKGHCYPAHCQCDSTNAHSHGGHSP